MDEMIRSKMHEALDVEQPASDLRSRVIGSLPTQESPNRGSKTRSFQWAAGFVAVFLAVAVVAAAFAVQQNTANLLLRQEQDKTRQEQQRTVRALFASNERSAQLALDRGLRLCQDGDVAVGLADILHAECLLIELRGLLRVLHRHRDVAQSCFGHLGCSSKSDGG